MENRQVATIPEDRALAIQELETRFAMAVRQRALLEQYIRERLKPDKHFYTVKRDDGGEGKPSLAKEGAELICLPHGYKPRYQILSGPENPPLDDTPYQITVKCELEAGGKFAGDGIGSASSMITKKDGTRVQRQKDPGLRHNATIKMASKSAYIAATLNSTAASEFFTQDMEDDQTGKEAAQSKEHWCAKHGVQFFKSGNMKSFAHPVGPKDEQGKQQWCSEPVKAEGKAAATSKEAGQAVDPSKKATPAPTGGVTEGSEPVQTQVQAPGTVKDPIQASADAKLIFDSSSGKAGFIDLGWLTATLATLKAKNLKAWTTDAFVIANLKAIYKVEAPTVAETVAKLGEGQAKHFCNRLQELLTA